MSEEKQPYFRLVQGDIRRAGFVRFMDVLNHFYKQGYELYNDSSMSLAPTINPYGVILKLTEYKGEIGRAYDTSLTIRADSIKIDKPVAAVVVEEEEAVEGIPVTKLDFLESISGKEALLDFAKENSITIPEDLKQPSAIKKFLIAAVKAEDPVTE